MDCDTAATIIQAHVRQYLAKRIYFQKLLEKSQKDEAVRHEKEQQQVSEGETLVIRLQMEIAELETIALNKRRRENAMATRIQRAWREYSSTNLNSVSSIQHTTDLLQYSTHSSSSAMAMNGSHVPTSTRNVVQDNETHASRVGQSGEYHSSGMANGVMPRRHAWVPGSNSYQLTSRQPLIKNYMSSQSKYRLCFTSDLSESSGEEQELSTTSHSNEEVENGHRSRSEEDWPGIYTRNDDFVMSMERRLKELVSTTDDLIFSDEFDDGSFQSNSERDSLLDSATLEIEDVSSRRSICSSPLSHGLVANEITHTT
ncbi:uncharacterized protein LOC135341411 isoform X2 [Halichondria panicea]|uniref:uncharacterized protein LOC135341411 isoform X2 n=1 Tax=Halichondria panicea TaxID=6063 RepID=UPI00312B7072